MAAEGGEIHYRLTGNQPRDATGSVRKRVKCIIYGWFFLADPNSLEPVRHDIEIESVLNLVASEEELPSLAAERDDEDSVVCGAKFDVVERIEEEILLDLPVASVAAGRASGEAENRGTGVRPVNPDEAVANTSTRISPFAKLAELKKK